jgi:hypothetical protein
MSKFLVLYRSSVPAHEQMAAATPEQVQAGMDAWLEWAKSAGDAIAGFGAPLGAARQIGSGGDHVTGFSILQAGSAEAAAQLVDGHPHLHTPGESSIELLEFLELPGM